MRSKFQHLLETTSYLIWLSLLVPVLVDPQRLSHVHSADWLRYWILLWLTFGTALLIGLRLGRRQIIARHIAFGLQSVTALALAWIRPDYYIGFLLILIAWQLAIFLRVQVAVGWVLLQATALSLVLSPLCSDGCGWVASIFYFLFQVFALFIVFLVRNEWTARLKQEHEVREIQSNQALLIERSKSDERLSLSRDLHDVLGHRLAGLSIHLEIGLNSTRADERERSIVKSKELVREMMNDVREVVGALRSTESMDLQQAVAALAANAPQLDVHTRIPFGLQLRDSELVHAFLRCVQEIITNAMKHANAANLWIDVDVEDNWIRIAARDDGHGVVVADLTPDSSRGFGAGGRGSRDAAESYQ